MSTNEDLKALSFSNLDKWIDQLERAVALKMWFGVDSVIEKMKKVQEGID